jgi:metal-responsive CopG/Arc/MetJ family transcriptional regulator
MAHSIRINITVDRETLRLADREARRQKTSRSEVIRRAVRTQAEREQLSVEQEGRRKRQERAIEGMHRLAQQFGDWPAEQILRAARDRRRPR